MFAFLSHEVVRLPVVEGKELYATDGSTVLSSRESDLACLTPCSQEADTCIFLHAADIVRKDYKKVSICPIDTDVVVLTVALFSQINPDDLWIVFGVGSSFQYIAVHEMVSTLSTSECKNLPVFHTFTGYDTISTFAR